MDDGRKFRPTKVSSLMTATASALNMPTCTRRARSSAARHQTVELALRKRPSMRALQQGGLVQYGAFDDLGRFGAVEVPPLPEAFESAEELAAWLSAQRNDLEAAAIRVAPPIGDVLEALSGEAETLLARMSGSGATCFGLFDDLSAAETAANALGRAEPDWWVAATTLVSRQGW